ncbi:MAG: type II secretion system F family protein [Vicinamibacterales bacterium]
MENLTPLALAGVFISVALLAGSIASMVLSRTATERRRLREVIETPRATAGSGITLQEALPLTYSGPGGGWDGIEALLPRSKKEIGRLRLRMTRAGIRFAGAPVIYSLAEFILPVVLGGATYFSGLLEPPTLWLAVGALAFLGFFLPGLWLERQLGKRRREIENGLPDALDLLVVCIEAGSGLDQAIVKTSEEIAFSYPTLGEELRILNSEVRAGKTRLDAFKNLAQRTKVDDVRALVAILIQTDKFGTSIGQALRTHADTARTKRRQRAEESAQKLGVKLVFPLVLFFFPALYAVILGPAIIQFMRQFVN